jgi:hypothetical protein
VTLVTGADDALLVAALLVEALLAPVALAALLLTALVMVLVLVLGLPVGFMGPLALALLLFAGAEGAGRLLRDDLEDEAACDPQETCSLTGCPGIVYTPDMATCRLQAEAPTEYLRPILHRMFLYLAPLVRRRGVVVVLVGGRRRGGQVR